MVKKNKVNNYVILCILLCNVLIMGVIFNTEDYSTVSDEIVNLQDKNVDKSILSGLDLNQIKNPINEDKKSLDTVSPIKIEDILLDIPIKNNNFNKNTEVIIIFDTNTNKNTRSQILLNICPTAQIKYNYNIIPGISAEIPTIELLSLIETINQIEEIEYISSNHHTQSIKTEFESNIINSWDAQFSTNNYWVEAIGADTVVQTGNGVNISILDTGISVHTDFYTNGNSNYPRIIAEKFFSTEGDITESTYTVDDFGHGTHCAGIAAGNGYLSGGKYVGVAPEASIINAKVSNSSGSISEDDVIQAIEWSITQGANILSMSFGNNDLNMWTAETLAIEYASNLGVITVAAAGNSGSDFYNSGTPSAGMHSISVGATDINNHVTDFSSNGPSYSKQILPDICAPGDNIISTLALNSYMDIEASFLESKIAEDDLFSYVSASGTSMATPMVAGAIALLLEEFPDATPETIRNALRETATTIERPTPSEGYGNSQGAGLINVPSAIAYLNNIQSNHGGISGDENKAVGAFPNKIPYTPFDLLRFPGDSTYLNITLYSGNASNYNIIYPDLQSEGIIFNSLVSSVNFPQHGINSLPLEIVILHNATSGEKIDYINITHSITGEIVEQILFNITVAFPKGNILFDYYHGLNDISFSDYTYSQMDLYHAMYDLMKLNYSLDYRMQDWTPNYSSDTDAQIITPDRLSKTDILILQPPIIPYSTYEIDAIKEYFLEGGSILFFGTKSENMCISSINQLFNALNCSIQVENENIFDVQDVILGQYLYTKSITNLNSSSPIFSGVNKYKFGFGSTFTVTGDAFELSSYGSSILAAEYNGTVDGKGKLVAFGDYHTFRNKYYDDVDYYNDHSKMLSNLMDYLNPEITHTNINNIRYDNQGASVYLSLPQRNISQGVFPFTTYVYNKTTQTPISGLLNGTTINATLILTNENNQTSFQSLFIDSSQDSEGIYSGEVGLTPSSSSNYTLTLMISVNINNINFTDTIKFFFYPEDIVDNYTLSNNNIFTRNSNNQNPSIIYSTYNQSGTPLPIIDSSEYVGITTNQFYAFKSLTELSQNNSTITVNEKNVSISPSNIKTGGLGFIYSLTRINNSIGHHMLDLTPRRYTFKVENNNPLIDEDSSKIGGISFSDTHDDNYVYAYQIEFNSLYSIELNVDETVNYEDKINDFSVTVCLFPVVSVNGLIHFLFPETIPIIDVNYDPSDDNFYGTFSIEEYLDFSSNGKTISKSIKSDGNTLFALMYMTVYDTEGGSDEFYMLFVLGDNSSPNEETNWIPLIILGFALLAACMIINRSGKKRKNRKSAPERDLIINNIYTTKNNSQDPQKPQNTRISNNNPNDQDFYQDDHE